MTEVTVRIPTPLRPFTNQQAEVAVHGSTVGQALADLCARHEGVGPRIFTADGELRRFVNVFVGEHHVSVLEGLATPVADGDVIAIIPAVAGGSARDDRLAALRRDIVELEPQAAWDRMQRGAVLVDVREQDEIAAGSPAGALHLGRGFLELRIEDAVPELDRPVMTLCGGGARSLFAAEDLRRLGYSNVSSVAGGFNRWKDQGLPFEVPRMLDAAARERYSRHLLMPEVGEQGQLKLQDSKVLLVGAGGLGSPAALYLAAAGIGTIGLVDHDVVDRSNLQRQVIHNEARVGEPKVESARAGIHALNPSVNVITHDCYLNADNVDALFDGYDVVLDGADNFPTRYLVNDACVKHGIPNVHGAVFRFEGQVSVFYPGRADAPGPCYRCLFPEPPPPELAPSCAEAGVLGVLPGVIGLLQSIEAVKLILGIGDPLVGRLLYFDALAMRFNELKMPRNPDCDYCGEGKPFPGYVDYQGFCAER
ncbi:MAG: molybdopterin-synthase adenylyltransferase MoeB [Ectothiorhodospiraceae bacterium]|nr:molybdopterin-synthase adenylyltransferase MoeB [Ectothiorhodospiraceae bacterium]